MTHPLVLLPGMGCSERLWAPVVARLERRDPASTVTVAPLRGRSLDACVDGLLAGLPDRFSLAGLSLGGVVAMAVARRAPERVSGLALLSTNPRAPRDDQRSAWAAQRRDLRLGRTVRDLQRDLLPVLLHPARRGPDLDEAVLAMADDVGEAALDEQLALQATRVDERPALARVAVPTLVVAAADDALCPVERHEEIVAAVTGARMAVLPGVGHLSPLEVPDDVAAELAGWWGVG